MTVSLFCYSDSGAKLAIKLCEMLNIEKNRVHSIEKFASVYGFTSHVKISEAVGKLFYENDALIFIGACGIAVRETAPYLRSKTTDPAVLVTDDRGKYVIPILSGHIGGANEYARQIAALLGAEAVITTSTDGAGKFSCDAWAAKNGYVISSMKAAKDVSAEILKRDVCVCSDYELPDVLPNGLVRGDKGATGIYIGTGDKSPFDNTLRLIPRTLTLGIGCRRGTVKEAIAEAVSTVFHNHCLDLRAIGKIASIDVKRDETGLLAFAEEIKAETLFYTAEELNSVQGEFEESEFVKKTVGTGNVCERAAAAGGGTVIVKKTALNGVTVAVAEEKRRIEF